MNYLFKEDQLKQFISILAEKKREERASVSATDAQPTSAGTTTKETNATAAAATTGQSGRKLSGASEAASYPIHVITITHIKTQLFPV